MGPMRRMGEGDAKGINYVIWRKEDDDDGVYGGGDGASMKAFYSSLSFYG